MLSTGLEYALVALAVAVFLRTLPDSVGSTHSVTSPTQVRHVSIILQALMVPGAFVLRCSTHRAQHRQASYLQLSLQQTKHLRCVVVLAH